MTDDVELQPGNVAEQLRHLLEGRGGLGLEVGTVEVKEDSVERDTAGALDAGGHFLRTDNDHALIHRRFFDDVDLDNRLAFHRSQATAQTHFVGRDIDGDSDIAFGPGEARGDEAVIGLIVFEDLGIEPGVTRPEAETEILFPSVEKGYETLRSEFLLVVAVDFKRGAAGGCEIGKTGDTPLDRLFFLDGAAFASGHAGVQGLTQRQKIFSEGLLAVFKDEAVLIALQDGMVFGAGFVLTLRHDGRNDESECDERAEGDKR